MTEAEWLACTESSRVLDLLIGKGSERKFRLFACACVRRAWHLLADERSRRAVETAERYADGLETEASLRAARDAAYEVATWPMREGRRTTSLAAQAAAFAAWNAADRAYNVRGFSVAASASWNAAAALSPDPLGENGAERAFQYRLLSDVLGNFGCPLPRLNPVWLVWEAGTVPKLAAAIYEERAFDRLSILADALEEAGCDAAELLAHLRGPGPHVRGCWALDLLLRRE
jgi:hypothetical protein